MRRILISILVFSIVYGPLYSARLYRVRRGDTMWGISRKFSVSLSRLKSLNKLSGRSLKAGMRLHLPGRSSRFAVIKSSNSGKWRWYRVARGDSVWSICRKFRMSRSAFARLNGFSRRSLRIGKQVKVYAAAVRYRSNKKRYSRRRTVTSFYAGRWRWYRVRRGDSLWRIARRSRVSVKNIRRLNGRRVRRIYAGQKIKLPVKGRLYARRARRVRGRRSRRRYRGRYFGRIPGSYAPGFYWPVKGRIIEKIGISAKGINNGITIKTSKGARVRASKSGVVTYCGQLRGYGRVVILRHRANVYTVYANLRSIYVRKGRIVSKGSVLASTGWMKRIGCHGLHFQMYYKTRPVNPLSYLS